MAGSDAMALSMIVSIPDLAQMYMEPMETANIKIDAYGITSSYNASARPAPCQTLIFQEAHLSSATV